jgi:hypothetical protein
MRTESNAVQAYMYPPKHATGYASIMPTYIGERNWIQTRWSLMIEW